MIAKEAQIQKEYIRGYFEEWEKDVQRAEKLLNSEYCLEGVLVLLTYIGALGTLRYPGCKDWKSYHNILLNYSDMRPLYENIDMLFFCQHSRSKFSGAKEYKKLCNHKALVKVFTDEYGNEDTIKNDPLKRYIRKDELLKVVAQKGTEWFDQDNFDLNIGLFSNSTILYKYGRCGAVHNAEYQLLNPSYSAETGELTYEDNHQITRDVILQTVKNILDNLKKECLEKNTWLDELDRQHRQIS